MASVESNDVRYLRQTRQLKGIEGSNNQHHITQTDEILTVVVSKTETSPSNSNKLDDLHRTSTSDNQSNDDNKTYHSHANGNVASLKIDDVLAMNIDHKNAENEENEDDGKIYPKSILTNCDNDKTKSLLRKKSVSFGNDEDITKFISGEEIVDKKNPFRPSNEEDYTEKFKITKVKKSIIPTKVPRNNTSAPKASIDETDYISKEEILKQSKYVPVYIRNPDRILTYDKSVLEKLTPSITSPKNIVKRAPVPVPRKSLNESLIKKPKEKRRTKYQWDHSKYPDLADIKVKTGPSEIDESLYDPNEVVLNAKKFDSLFKKLQFGSTDDIDEISEKSLDRESNESKSKIVGKEAPVEEEKKSYTNTVNSSEFREYLKKKGLVLFPVKANGTNSNSSSVKTELQKKSLNAGSKNLSLIEEKPVEMDQIDKKKTVFRRLSSIFSKSKTTPKANGTAPRLSFTDKNEDNRNSAVKRVVLDRSGVPNSDNRPILANNEFFTSHNFLRNKQTEKFARENDDDEDKKSSISSVLTAAADDDNVFETPVAIRKAKPDASQYRNIDLSRSKLYQTVNKKPTIHPPSFDNLSQQLGDDVIKPRVYRPSLLNRTQPVMKSQIKPPVPLRRSSERQSLPMTRIDKQNVQLRSRAMNDRSFGETPLKIQEVKVKTSSTPNEKEKPSMSPDVSPISNKHSEIDPFTFAKIHEIKKKTDAVLMNKSMNFENPQPKMNNQNFIRNSEQRSTISEMYRNPYATSSKGRSDENYGMYGTSRQQPSSQQPPRSQSVLDNMTCYKNSLYGEVTYRQSNGDNVNVIMRRPESSTLDKRQVMQKIYEYYRKSVNNTPISFQEHNNLQMQSQSTDTSPSYASVNTTTRSTLPKLLKQNDFYVIPKTNGGPMPQKSSNTMPRNENLQATRKPTISDSTKDNNIRYLPPNDVPVYRRNSTKTDNDSNRIYDVVYGSTAYVGNGNQNAMKYLKNDAQIHRPTSAMDRSEAVYARNLRQISMNSGRATPLILHPSSIPRHLPNQMDIIYNNQIYRPVSALQQRPVSSQQNVRNGDKIDYNGGYNYHSSLLRNRNLMTPDSEGSEIGEVGRIMQNHRYMSEEDYQNDKSNRNQQNDQVVDDRSRRSSGRRDDRERDLRRHTLGSDMLHYANQGGSLQRSMDLEMSQPQKSRKGIPIRAYTPQHQGPLFDDDPGIMSEVETASTGFRRGGKQRSSLPVVRTPSKTLERPLGLVFLQYRSETKRALLPNEITSIDTVRALFVRSFPRQLSMAYLEGPNVKIYIHDSSKDMFYELEDVRSHLREIRDRSVLRLFESNEVAAAPQILSGSPGIPQALPQQSGHWDQDPVGLGDPSYFSEPEFDSEYQHQHIHKSKTGKAAPYYVGTQTLPRGHVYNDRSKNSMNVPAKPIRSYGSRGSLGQFPYSSDQLYSIPDGYMSSPERGTRAYEEPYYTQYGGSRGSSVTPIIDEEQNDSSLIEDQYSMYPVKVPNRISRNPNQMYDPARPEDLHRIRVEHMERQLANLTGLVQKALVQNPQQNSVGPQQQQYLGVGGGQYRNANGALDDLYIREKPPKLGKSYKSVSFEKSVSFSDDIQGVPKAHSPQHMAADSKPPKPAIKSSTLPRTSSQERDRLTTCKPLPPAKQQSISNQYRTDITLAPEVYNHLRGLQKKAKDLRTEVKTLRRLAQTQAVAVREDIKDTFMRIRATLLASSGNQWGQCDQERTRISREEEIYKQEVIRLEKDLADLEGSVEVLRGEVINRRTRVNMAAVEDMALVLSRASKTVAELKMRFPSLQVNLRNILSNEMEKVCREETFLKEEPDRLEVALRRCKKLTGTLVTLKRLASVQEQRTVVDPVQPDEAPRSANEFSSNTNKPTPSPRQNNAVVPENALDALLDELQTFSNVKPELRPDESATSDDSSQTLQSTVTTKLSQSQLYPEPVSSSVHGLRRLASYPSGSDTSDQDQISPPRPTGKPPVPERNSELLQRYGHKKLPPPPPPRTSSSSRSPLASPTSPNLPPRNSEQQSNNINNNTSYLQNDPDSGSESANSQDNSSQRQHQLEMRHQELLKKQKQLQEQYQRLQKMSAIPLAPGGNENLSSSMRNLAAAENADNNNDTAPLQTTVTNKVYETDIL